MLSKSRKHLFQSSRRLQAVGRFWPNCNLEKRHYNLPPAKPHKKGTLITGGCVFVSELSFQVCSSALLVKGLCFWLIMSVMSQCLSAIFEQC